MIKRPKQEEFIEWDRFGDGHVNDFHYAEALEKYCDELEMERDTLKCWDKLAFKYCQGMKEALLMAVNDAMNDVSEWGRYADARDERAEYDRCIKKNQSYTLGIAEFYENLGIEKAWASEKEAD